MKFFIPILSLLFACNLSVFAQDKSVVFPGCDSKDNSKIETCFNESIMVFVSKNVSYPKEAIDAKKEGTVYIKFVVDKSGNITQVENALPGNGLGYGLEDEAIKVVRKMPKMEPALKDGKPVDANFVIPVRFSFSR